MPTVLGHGVYTYAEAARLTGLHRARIGEWFRGQPSAQQASTFQSDYEPVEGEHAISFLDLIDVFVAGHLRDDGVSLQTLRTVYNHLARALETHHPFSREEVRSEGKKVFMRGMDEAGRHELTETLTRQKVFARVIEPFLEKIDYDAVSNLAARWHIAKGVVVDPRICFGKPIVEGISIPTAILASAYNANDQDAPAVASWYNVRTEHVIAAVEFESKLAA
jgi:uncharacterized protein (DUF433 family)